ncbi:MAG: hypothetical protein Tsb0021_04060 [Chlamydiales bacterium]
MLIEDVNGVQQSLWIRRIGSFQGREFSIAMPRNRKDIFALLKFIEIIALAVLAIGIPANFTIEYLNDQDKHNLYKVIVLWIAVPTSCYLAAVGILKSLDAFIYMEE